MTKNSPLCCGMSVHGLKGSGLSHMAGGGRGFFVQFRPEWMRERQRRRLLLADFVGSVKLTRTNENGNGRISHSLRLAYLPALALVTYRIGFQDGVTIVSCLTSSLVKSSRDNHFFLIPEIPNTIFMQVVNTDMRRRQLLIK